MNKLELIDTLKGCEGSGPRQVIDLTNKMV